MSGRLRRLLSRRDDHLEEEISLHLEALARGHESAGLSPEDARLAARRDFGGPLQVREDYRDQAGRRWLDEWSQDLKFAARSLRLKPAFTAIATATLALGIGATTAIFSVVNSALLKPLPYPGGERLVRLRAVITAPDGQSRRIPVNLTAREREELATRARTLDHVANANMAVMNWRGREPRWQGARVSASTFAMLGVQPVLGRVFEAADERADANSLLLSAQSWQRDFGGDPNVLGQTVTLEAVLGPPDRAVYTIVGVLPESFEYPSARVRFWMPFASASGSGPPPRAAAVARLASGVSFEAAAADIGPILRALEVANQANGRQSGPPTVGYEVVGEQADRVRLVKPSLIAVSGAVGFVLLIACVNVASLLLARTAARQREIAIRTAIGAGRGRLLRLAIAESLVLASLGGVAGSALAFASVRLLQSLTGSPYRLDIDIDGRNTFPGIETVTLDGSVLLFTIFLALVAGLLLGIAPALHYMRATPNVILRSGSGTARRDKGHVGVRNMLVIVEVAMAMMLLVGGGLLMASFVRLANVDAGYMAEGVMTFQVSLPTERYPLTRIRTFSEELASRLAGVQGVGAAAYANQLPMVGLRDTAGGLWCTPDTTRRFGPADAADARFVSHDYFAAMGIPVVAGRGLSADDGENAQRVLLVNEALARRDFGGRDAVGQMVYVGNDPQPWEIVGIAGNVRQFWLNREAEPQFFLDARQWSGRGPLFPVGAYYAVRTVREQAGATTTIERIVKDIEPEAVVFNLAPMSQLVSDTLGRPRLYAVLLGLFAAIGLMLAVIGIYGVMAYGVEQRTREIGVRLALGARSRDVLGMVMVSAAWLATSGIAIGLVGAALVTRFLTSMLFGVAPLDLPIFVGMAALFAVVAALASFVPARRATKVDPLVSLRAE